MIIDPDQNFSQENKIIAPLSFYFLLSAIVAKVFLGKFWICEGGIGSWGWLAGKLGEQISLLRTDTMTCLSLEQ